MEIPLARPLPLLRAAEKIESFLARTRDAGRSIRFVDGAGRLFAFDGYELGHDNITMFYKVGELTRTVDLGDSACVLSIGDHALCGRDVQGQSWKLSNLPLDTPTADDSI